MKQFNGSTICKLDSSGRLKLPPNAVSDFKRVDTSGKVILKLLPEGAIAIVPANTLQPEPSQETSVKDYLTNPVTRHRVRREIFFYTEDEISQQGRLTISTSMLDRIGVKAGGEVALIGFQYGYEIWKPEALEAEIDKELAQGNAVYEQTREL